MKLFTLKSTLLFSFCLMACDDDAPKVVVDAMVDAGLSVRRIRRARHFAFSVMANDFSATPTAAAKSLQRARRSHAAFLERWATDTA